MTDVDEHQAVDSMAPWTIKSVSTKTRETITQAAKKEGRTVGQWLDKRISEWRGDGSPIHVQPTSPSNLAEIAQLMEATLKLATASNVAVPPQLAKDGLGLLRQAVKQTKRASQSNQTMARITAS
jgi:hypothetical protein